MWITGNLASDMTNDISEYGLESTHRRFYSKYKGDAEQNLDPQQQGRVKVSVPDTGNMQIVGSSVNTQTLELFAYPSSPFAGNNYGFYFPPEMGDQVWVWFDMGDPTQPNISGGWWLNKGSNPPSSNSIIITDQNTKQQKVTTKAPTYSQIPVEFNTVLNGTLNTNDVKNNSITTSILSSRGIKTKLGHGIIFEDDNQFGRDTGVTLWSGASAPVPPTPAGQPAFQPLPAIRHHSINLSDRDKRITITSFGSGPVQNGHTTIWDDLPATQGIRTTSIYGNFININDVTKSITIATGAKPEGQQIILSDITNSITATTFGGNTLLLNDDLQTVSLTSIEQQSLVMNDAALSTSIFTPGLMSITAGAATTITAGAAATLSAAGAVAITGTGVAITSAGGGPSVTFASGISESTFVGLVNENYLGALEQIIIGAWNVEVGTATIVSNLITLGALTNTKFYLVTDAFIDAFNLHTHPIPDPGASAVTSTPSTPLVKATYVTQNVMAS
jgi:Type VI secretion system/phage-baseplate injector OB domain